MEQSKVNEILVRYIILNGMLVVHESKYGTQNDYPKSVKIREKIDKYVEGINWKKSEAPKTNNESEFNGTFCEDTYITCMKTKLYHKGFKDPDIWKMKLDEDVNFQELIQMVIEFMEEQKSD